MDSENGSSSKSKQKKIEDVQAQVKAVTDVMRENVNKIVQRGEALEQLDQRAEDLERGTSQFSAGTRRLRQKYWWQNMKMNLIIGAFATGLIIIIIVWASR